MAQLPSAGEHRLLRILAFAIPHWRWVVVAVIGMVGYAAVAASGVLVFRRVAEGALQSPEKGKVVCPHCREVVVVSEAERHVERETESRGDKPATIMDTVSRLRDDVGNWFQSIGVVRTVSDYIAPGPDQLARVGILTLCLVAPLWGLTMFIQTYASGVVVRLIMADIRIALFNRLSRMPLAFFARTETGDLISRTTTDVSQTQTLMRITFTDLLLQPIKVVGFISVALYASWEVTIFAVIAVPVLGLIIGGFGRRIHRYGRKSLDKLGDITDALNQLLTGIRVVKAFGMEEEEQQEFRGRNREQLRQVFRLVRTQSLSQALAQATLGMVIGVMLMWGHHLLTSGTIEKEDLVAAIVAIAFSAGPVKRTFKCYNNLQQHMGAVDRVFEVIDLESDLPDAEGAVALNGVRQGVRFRNVSFGYDTGRPVLQGIDLDVPAGTVCAIVGETGAGKSTMLDLVPRFYDTSEGSVEIDGRDVRDVRRASLLDNIAIVGQHPFLFNRSIAQNIRYGRRAATDQEVVAAAEAARLKEVVAARPEKYDASVGERGASLSGGQRQCVTIARAMLKNAPILILDEATSSLDNESERMVQRALQNLMSGRTTFVIAHRLSTVRFADMIVVLRAGRIVEKGSHDELLEANGEYAKLYHMQFADGDEANA